MSLLPVPGGSVPLRDLNCKLRMPLFPRGPQLQIPDGSVSTRASTVPPTTVFLISTESSRWQCSHSDLNRELPMAVFPPNP